MEFKMIRSSLFLIVMSLICSPLIFMAMFLDYKSSISWFYLMPALFPVLFQRKFTHVVIFSIVGAVVSGVLVHYIIHVTGVYFYPFDNQLEVLVILEALFFGIVQSLLFMIIKSFKGYRKPS